MEIKVEKLTEDMLKELRVREWLIWEKEVSRFEWHYDETEVCYIIQKGLSCVWDIKKPIKKYFNFTE
jgi:uncharacterized cupin superfamily protein